MKFTKKAIEAIEAAEKRQVFFDETFPGFALRVSEAGAKTFYYSYRAGKGRGAEKKWVMLGRFPAMTVEQALAKAKGMAADVHQGTDPAKELRVEKAAITMEAALEKFTQIHVDKLKLETQKQYNAIKVRLLIPKLGKTRVKNVQHPDVAKLHYELRATPYLANRCIAVLSKFFSWCELNGYRERNSNPCFGVEKYKENKRQDFMGADELAILGETLDRLERTWLERQETKEKRVAGQVDALTPQAAAVIRMLMFTGARVGEVLSLKWVYIDFERGIASLPDSKTGFKVLQLPAPAMAVLEGLPQFSEWVFPGNSAVGHMVNIKDAWGAVLKQSGLANWRLHDLRHAFASMMVNSGASLPIIGKILGHSQVSTTQRYAHLEQNPARKAAEDAAEKIAAALRSKPAKGNVLLFDKANGQA